MHYTCVSDYHNIEFKVIRKYHCHFQCSLWVRYWQIQRNPLLERGNKNVFNFFQISLYNNSVCILRPQCYLVAVCAVFGSTCRERGHITHTLHRWPKSTDQHAHGMRHDGGDEEYWRWSHGIMATATLSWGWWDQESENSNHRIGVICYYNQKGAILWSNHRINK